MRWLVFVGLLTACGGASPVDREEVRGPEPAVGAGDPVDAVPSLPPDPPSGLCRLDSRTLITVQSQPAESVIVGGKMWNFVGLAGKVEGPAEGTDLTTVPRFASGPCAGREPLSCRFQTRTLAVIDGAVWESITAYGRFWNFIGDAQEPSELNGSDLTSVERYASGPCAGKAPGTCVFDTRTFVEWNGEIWETITAYGRYWNFRGATFVPDSANGSDLVSVPRFANGPCAGKAPLTCKLDTRNFVVQDGVMTETVTGDGRYWNFVGPNSTPVAQNGDLLSSVPRYASGPCASTAR